MLMEYHSETHRADLFSDEGPPIFKHELDDWTLYSRGIYEWLVRWN